MSEFTLFQRFAPGFLLQLYTQITQLWARCF